MSIKDTQERIAEFVKKHDLATSPENRLFDLISEVGELSKEVLKANNYGYSLTTLHSKLRPEWAEEMGDVFFALICLANSTNVKLDDALDTVLAKYEARLHAKGEAGSDS